MTDPAIFERQSNGTAADTTTAVKGDSLSSNQVRKLSDTTVDEVLKQNGAPDPLAKEVVRNFSADQLLKMSDAELAKLSPKEQENAAKTLQGRLDSLNNRYEDKSSKFSGISTQADRLVQAYELEYGPLPDSIMDGKPDRKTKEPTAGKYGRKLNDVLAAIQEREGQAADRKDDLVSRSSASNLDRYFSSTLKSDLTPEQLRTMDGQTGGLAGLKRAVNDRQSTIGILEALDKDFEAAKSDKLYKAAKEGIENSENHIDGMIDAREDKNKKKNNSNSTWILGRPDKDKELGQYLDDASDQNKAVHKLLKGLLELDAAQAVIEKRCPPVAVATETPAQVQAVSTNQAAPAQRPDVRTGATVSVDRVEVISLGNRVEIRNIQFVDQDGTTEGQRARGYKEGTMGQIYPAAARNVVEALITKGAVQQYQYAGATYDLTTQGGVDGLIRAIHSNPSEIIKDKKSESGSIIISGSILK